MLTDRAGISIAKSETRQRRLLRLDVYSLWDSLRVVLEHLGEHDPEALDAARRAYHCFEPYGEDPQRYAWSTRLVPQSCEDDVVRLLVELRQRAVDPDGDSEAPLDARQNAEVIAGAERYYRSMVCADGESWNVRDCRMADTLDRLMDHHGPEAKAIVWEHNTHIGDVRATDMAGAGMANVVQLVRERHGDEGVVLVGFAGHRGSVIAAESGADRCSTWRSPRRRPAPTRSSSERPSVTSPPSWCSPRAVGAWLSSRRWHRAIGVVYDPARDVYGNWVPSVLGQRYDAWLWFPDTEALHPLHLEAAQRGAEQETEPWVPDDRRSPAPRRGMRTLAVAPSACPCRRPLPGASEPPRG